MNRLNVIVEYVLDLLHLIGAERQKRRQKKQEPPTELQEKPNMTLNIK